MSARIFSMLPSDPRVLLLARGFEYSYSIGGTRPHFRNCRRKQRPKGQERHPVLVSQAPSPRACVEGGTSGSKDEVHSEPVGFPRRAGASHNCVRCEWSRPSPLYGRTRSHLVPGALAGSPICGGARLVVLRMARYGNPAFAPSSRARHSRPDRQTPCATSRWTSRNRWDTSPVTAAASTECVVPGVSSRPSHAAEWGTTIAWPGLRQLVVHRQNPETGATPRFFRSQAECGEGTRQVSWQEVHAGVRVAKRVPDNRPRSSGILAAIWFALSGALDAKCPGCGGTRDRRNAAPSLPKIFSWQRTRIGKKIPLHPWVQI